MFWAGVLSLSRGGMIGIAVVIVLIWFKSRHKVFSLILLLIGVVVFSYNMPEEYKAEMNSIVEEGSTSGTGRERIEFWKASTRIFLAYPILGIGQGNIPYRINEFKGDKYWTRDIGGKVVHSLYFTLIPELGLVGIIIFSLFLRLIIKYSKVLLRSKNYHDLMLVNGLMIGFAAFFVTGAFLSVLYYPHFWILTTLINALWINKDHCVSDQAGACLSITSV